MTPRVVRLATFSGTFVVSTVVLQVVMAHMARKYFHVKWYGRGTA